MSMQFVGPDVATGLSATAAWRCAPHFYAKYASFGRWKMARWLKFLGTELALAVTRGDGRLIVNAPPRHGKSYLTSYWTPVWLLDNWPHNRIILTSYGDALASEFGRMCRNEMEQNPFCRTRLREDSTSAGRWHTPQGGGMTVAGVGGPISGKGADLIIIDDPIKNWQEAHSAQTKTVLREWYQSTLRTRLEPHGTIIVSMTRWSDDDFVTWLMSDGSERWHLISLPALALPDDPLGRKPGEPLFPERYDADGLKNIEREVGVGVWAALYQQRPLSFALGRLYGNMSDANIDPGAVLRSDLPLAVTFDFNVNPGMHGLIGQYDNKLDLFTEIDEIHGPRMSTVEAMQKFKGWLQAHGWQPGKPLPWPELHVFGDASGEGQWAGTAESCYDLVRKELRAWGVRFRIRHLNQNPPVRERLDTVNDALCDVEGKIHVRIHPRCAILIRDLKTMRSDENGLEDKREHALSHMSSALGYEIHFLRPLWQDNRKTVGGRIGIGRA